MNAPYLPPPQQQQQYQNQPHLQQQQQFHPSQPPPSSGAGQQQQQKGTLFPGQQLSVGKVKVTVEKYLSEGGFAHVYLVKTQELINGTDRHVLKRVAVREKSLLDEVRREVEVMKLLRGHPNIVNLIDADAFKLPDGTHEVLILMEFASGGGIIDMMNRRLRERLTEEEILQVFVDVCEGVAKMHSLSPPLIHRDLKVENILQSGPKLFKLCDFGSVAVSHPRPSSMAEMREVELDINTHTTMQYRAPEMVDVYQRRVIDEKSDIWALGVLLYKLCYYTTPFEEHGPLAILNVQYRVPPFPVYSNRINLLIGSMLQEYGHQRPSAVQILTTVHSMRGTKSPFHYNEPKSSQPTNSNSQNLFDIISSVPAPVAAAPTLNVTPMRRGRPTKGAGGVEEPSPGPVPVPVVPGGGGKAAFNLTGERVPPPQVQAQPKPFNGFAPPKPSFSSDFAPRGGPSPSSSGGGFASNFTPSTSKPLVTSPLPTKTNLPAPNAGASFSSTSSSGSYNPTRSFQPNPSFSASSATPLFRPSPSSSLNAPAPISKSPQFSSPAAAFDGFSDLLEPVHPVSTATSAKSASKWTPTNASTSAKVAAGASSPSSWTNSFSSGFGDSFAPSPSKPSSPLPIPSSTSASKQEPGTEPSFDDRFPSFETFDSTPSPSNTLPPQPPLPERRYTRSPSPPRPAKAPSPSPPTIVQPQPLTKQSFVHHLTGPSVTPTSSAFLSSQKTNDSTFNTTSSQPLHHSRSTHVTGAAMDAPKPSRGEKELPSSEGVQSDGWSQLERAAENEFEEKKVREDWLTGDDGYSALQDPKTIHKAMSPSPSSTNIKVKPPVVAPKPSLDLSSSKFKNGGSSNAAHSEPSFSPIAPSSSASNDRQSPSRGKTLPPPAITAPKPTSFVTSSLTSTAKPVRPRLNEPVLSSSSILSDQWSPLEDARAKLKEEAAQLKPVARKGSSSSGDDTPEEPGRVVGRGVGGGEGGWKARSGGVEVGGLSAKEVDEFGSRRYGTLPTSAPAVASKPTWFASSSSASTPLASNPRIGGPRTPNPPSSSSSSQPSASLYNAPPRLTTTNSSSSNAPRRLPTIDPESASSFLRGSHKPSSSISSPGAAAPTPRARPQSLYVSNTTPSSASAGFRSPGLSSASSAGSGAGGGYLPSKQHVEKTPLVTSSPPPPPSQTQPAHRRSTSISGRASRFESSAPAPAPTSSSSSSTTPSSSTTVSKPAPPPPLNTRLSGLGSRSAANPLKGITPTRESQDAPKLTRGVEREKEKEKKVAAGRGETSPERPRPSVSSLKSFWEQGR